MNNLKIFCKQNRRYMLASFFFPFFIMMLLYLTIGIYPGSSRSILASDAFSQFSNFHASYRNALLGKQSFLFTWNASLGLNYLSLISYYLGGLFTPLVLFFPNQYMPDALYFLTLIKIGSAGLAFWFYAKHTFTIHPKSHVILAICYSLMSFVTVHSELIMWLDAYVYLPFVIWGIDRLLQKNRPKMLFFSYLLLFISSFYMGFMIGIFSVLYFLARLFSKWKENKGHISHYLLTSFLAGGASMIIILPALLDLRSNGEKLTEITKFKTEATGVFDFFVKNMISVYDTTKYGSIPFIFIGLLPLGFCLYYFVAKKVPLKDKLLYLAIAAILMTSFYVVPLNLFWHGMHAPNMFLFRYAFLLSFLIIMLAGYGWEQFNKKDRGRLVSVFLLLIGLFCLVYGMIPKGQYDYLSVTSFALTIAFLVVYLLIFWLYQSNFFSAKTTTSFLLLFVCLEMGVNTNGMLHGILDEWNYASRSLYTEPYPAIKNLVDQTKEENDSFYRLENLDPVSSNDSINYGYSGISQFSSIRNRNSSSYLDALGFRSQGTNLNIRYLNNTLLMDSFTGIKYNLTKQEIQKYGFTEVGKKNDYLLYENKNALPLAFTADPSIASLKKYSNDNLRSQTALFNELAQLNQTYFTFHPLTVVSTKNTTMTTTGNHTLFKEETSNTAKDVTWSVDVPAHSQAYLSLYPSNFGKLENSTATLIVNGQERKTQININGQYYDLGNYEKDTTVEFTVSFYGTSEVSFQNPQVVTLDTQAFQQAFDKISENGVTMTVNNRQAKGEINQNKETELVTTIPYDKGWKAKIDGKEVPVKAFQDAFVRITVPKGKHKIEFSYIPQGFLLGLFLCISCIVLFLIYDWQYKKKRT